MNKSYFALALSIFLSFSAFSQHNFCGTDLIYKKQIEANPKAKAASELRLQNLRNVSEIHKANKSGVRIIPVVFHVIHNYGSENVPKEIIDETIEIMNADFRKNNEFISDITSNFSGIATDCEVEFRLATIDPDGNCTQGITRTVSSETENASDNVKDLIRWPNQRYLNVWVVKSIELDNSGDGTTLGYAYYPDVTQWNPSIDGIVVIASALGQNSSRNGRTMTHEVGHYLGLPHTFDGPCNQDGDGISDTPRENGDAYFGCDYNYNPCGTNLPANIENFMSYASCQKMYTAGQKTEINQTFSQYRSTLVSSNNLINTGTQDPNMVVDCQPIADFESDEKKVCQGEAVQFFDISYNGTPTTYAWSFPGGAPSTSTDANPTVVFNTPGDKNISLTVSNAQGQDQIVKNTFIRVEPAVAANSNPPYVEGFEAQPLTSGTWYVENPDNNVSWAETSVAAASGNTSMRITNVANSNLDQIDNLISESYNFSLIDDLEFKFKVAYRRKNENSTDVLKVYFSINCGKSWILRYVKTASALSTAPDGTLSFVPNASQWREETVNLSNQIRNATNVKVKFEFTSGGGNNIFIDDINISGSVGFNEAAKSISSFDVYPNPTTQDSKVFISSSNKFNGRLYLSDISGRIINQIPILLSQGGEEKEVPFVELASSLSEGLYFISLENSETKLVRRVIITK